MKNKLKYRFDTCTTSQKLTPDVVQLLLWSLPSFPAFILSQQNFAKEFMISDPRELEEDYIREELKKAGGANYDAQTE